MKRIIKILAGFIAVCGLAVLIYVVSSKQKEVNCIGMDIQINYPDQDVFIRKTEIEKTVNEAYTNIYSVKINDISTEKLEKLILQNPYVKTVNVYSTIQGEIKINIEQRQPIFRVEMEKESFYVDNYGSFMPLSPKYVSRLVVVSGNIGPVDMSKTQSINIGTPTEIKDLASIFRLVLEIRKNPFVNALVEQIYVNKNKEIELIPKLGTQYILFGKAEDISDKIGKIQLFYQKGMPINGWEAYKVINVKYKNQVVCTKI